MPRTNIDVRWGELDPYNHVNHATYLTYCEQGRIAALHDIGWDMDVLEQAGFRVVVVEVTVAFRTAAGANDRLVVDSTLIHLGASASAWRQVILRGEEVMVEATIRAACTDLSGKPVRMPDDFRTALQPLLESA